VACGHFVDFDARPECRRQALARALGDSAENPRFIETLSRRGYRFLVPVNGMGQECTPIPRARRHWRIALAAAILFLVGIVAGWQPDITPPLRSDSRNAV